MYSVHGLHYRGTMARQPTLDAREIRARIAANPDGFDRTSAIAFEVDGSGRCERPVPWETMHRATQSIRRAGIRDHVPYDPDTAGAYDGAPVILRGDARCRKCDACRRYRQKLWTARAIAEIKAASRTWFGTLTLGPHVQQHFLDVLRLKGHRGGYDFDALPEHEQFSMRANACGAECTKYLKRVRYESGALLRYVWVAEAHASGAPHFHCLVHEYGTAVPKRVLRGQWTLGFTKWKLVEHQGAAGYVCKYLYKSSMARVRASVRYGEGPLIGSFREVSPQAGKDPSISAIAHRSEATTSPQAPGRSRPSETLPGKDEHTTPTPPFNSGVMDCPF